MNRRSSTKKSPKPVNPKSDPDGKLWFRQINDTLFQSTVSGSRSSTGTGEVENVTGPESKQSKTEMTRRVAITGSSPIGHSRMRYSPGADPGMLWRKLIQERQKNKILQVEVGRLKTSLELCRKKVREKSSEIELKNKQINKLIEDKTSIEASHAVMENEVDIDNLLHANLGDLTMKDILNLTDTNFPADLIDLDMTNLDLQTEQTDHSSSLSSMGMGTSVNAEEAVELLQIPNREKNIETDFRLDKIEALGRLPRYSSLEAKDDKTCSNQKVSPFKIIREDNQYQLVKKRKYLAFPQPTSVGSSSKKRKFLPLTTVKFLSCPHCWKTYPRGSQWKLIKHLSSSHNNDISYPCQHCDKQFPCESILKAHTLRHRLTHPWQCENCRYKPVNIRSFIKHVKSAHEVTSLTTVRRMLILSND